MAAQHPFVAHGIKAEKRLIPIQRALIPSGVSRIVKSLGALAHQSRDVHGILFLLPARTMGQEIKAADDAVFPRFTHPDPNQEADDSANRAHISAPNDAFLSFEFIV